MASRGTCIALNILSHICTYLFFLESLLCFDQVTRSVCGVIMGPCALCTHFPAPRRASSNHIATGGITLGSSHNFGKLTFGYLHCARERLGERVRRAPPLLRVTREDRQDVTQFSLSAKNTLGQLRYVAQSAL